MHEVNCCICCMMEPPKSHEVKFGEVTTSLLELSRHNHCCWL
jgi:hypothetical protein